MGVEGVEDGVDGGCVVDVGEVAHVWVGGVPFAELDLRGGGRSSRCQCVGSALLRWLDLELSVERWGVRAKSRHEKRKVKSILGLSCCSCMLTSGMGGHLPEGMSVDW